MESKICSNCKSFIQTLQAPAVETKSPEIKDISYHSFRLIKEGAEDGCCFCSIVLGKLPSHEDQESHLKLLDEKLEVSFWPNSSSEVCLFFKKEPRNQFVFVMTGAKCK
jgi:hypothetical protein